MNMQPLALAFLATAAVGGIAWVFVYPMLSGEKKAENRRASVAKSEPVAARQSQKDQRSRREQVEGTLKEAEARRAKDSKVTLTTRLTQAGLEWEPRKFWIFSFIFLRSRSTLERLPSASERLPPDFCWIDTTMPKKLASGSGIRS